MTQFLPFFLFFSLWADHAKLLAIVETYQKFEVKELTIGKNVTVGKYVKAYIDLDESVSVKGANPPQRFQIEVEWKNKKNKPFVIDGHWLKKNSKIVISKKLNKSKKPSQSIIIKGGKPNQISFPVTSTSKVEIATQWADFKKFNKDMRIVVSSSSAFEIFRNR